MPTQSQPRRTSRRFGKGLGLAAVVLVLALVAAEAGLRLLLFSGLEVGAPLRDPGLYADYFSEDLYWRLYYRFGGKHTPPKRPHPVLGWVGSFSRKTLRHEEAPAVGGRRPVLLFGDSFAACVPGVVCYGELLNGDETFSRDRYLLNYGVGGYGFDQIYLLLREAIDLYDDPFLVVGLLTFDLDRSILSVFTGQKPRFRVSGGRLELDPTPIEPVAADYFAAHPPRAPSYLYRRLLFSQLLPRELAARLRGEAESRRRKMEVNEAIFLAILGELRSRGLDFVFLVFHTHYPDVSELVGVDDWRNEFLRSLLDEHEVPYIWSKDVVAADPAGTASDPWLYIDREHLHPTERFNRLLAAEIERRTR